MKKFMVIILCMFFFVGVMGGCNNGSKTTGRTTDKVPELRALYPANATDHDPNDYFVQKVLEERTGYKVKYETLPAENANDKLNLLMANKEPYDFIKLTAAQFTKLAQEGALEPLDDLLKEHGRRILEVTAEETFIGAKIDGVTYGIPEKNAKDSVGTALAIRKGLLDELKLEIPTTTDEFYIFLKTIKEKTDTIPMVMHNNQAIIPEIAGAFGISTQWQVEDGKILHRDENPQIKAYLEYMNKLYEEKLIDAEMPANTSAIIQEKFTSGKAAVFQYAWWTAPVLVPAMQKTFPNDEIILIPALKGKDGQSGHWLNQGIGMYTAIPKVSKNKVDTMKYLNEKLQPETFRLMVVGEKDVHYTDKDGVKDPILPTFFDERGRADWYLTGTDQEAYADLWLIRARKDPVQFDVFEEIQEKMMPIAKAEPLAFAPSFPTISKNGQKLNKLENDSFIRFIAGADPLSKYDDYLKEWKAEGGEECLEEINEWYSKQK